MSWDDAERFFTDQGDAAAVESVKRKRRLARDANPPDYASKGTGGAVVGWHGPPERMERVGTVTND